MYRVALLSIFCIFFESSSYAVAQSPMRCRDILNIDKKAVTENVTIFEAVFDSFENIKRRDLVDNGKVLRVLDQVGDERPKYYAPRQSFWTLQNRFSNEQIIQHIQALAYLSYDSRLTQESNWFKTKVLKGLSYEQLEEIWADSYQQYFNAKTFVEVNLVLVKVKGVEEMFSLFGTSGNFIFVSDDVSRQAGQFIKDLVNKYGSEQIEFVANFHTHPHFFESEEDNGKYKRGFMAVATAPDFHSYKITHSRYFKSVSREKHLEFAVAFSDNSQIILSEYGFNIDWERFNAPDFDVWSW